jgi:hypothetical protein
MMAIMFDPCFKALPIVESFVGHENVIQLTFEHDAKVVIPFLIMCFEQLNPSTISSTTSQT